VLKNFLERNRLWAWGLGAALITTFIVLGYCTLETERQPSAVQNDRESAAEQGPQAKAAELGPVVENLQSKLDNAEKEIQRLNEAAANAEARASEYEKRIALLRQGRATCEEFFDGWDIKAAPPNIVTLFGVAREATAATDCLQKGNAATACKHWESLLSQIKKIGSPVSDSRSEIEDLIRKHNCKNL
jgi:DNA repair exonuclease SbcCD ATPase subunit